MSVLLTEGSDSCHVMGFGCSTLGVSCGLVVASVIKALLIMIKALASAMSLLSRCNSSVVGSDVLFLRGFGRG